jgi:hypothetical protein
MQPFIRIHIEILLISEAPILNIKETELFIEVNIYFLIELSPSKAIIGVSRNMKSMPTIDRDTDA